jgi:hypothetical protein
VCWHTSLCVGFVPQMTVGIVLLFGWLEIMISHSLRKLFAWLLGRIIFSVLETGPFMAPYLSGAVLRDIVCLLRSVCYWLWSHRRGSVPR